MIRLDWVPKPFRDGDIAGEGTKKLLGTSLAAPKLFLRETAQNSWDAHIGHGVIPEYQMRFVTLDAPRMSVLRNFVFPETFPGSELAKVIRRSRVSAIEVHDRGTTGLDGPTRNDVHVGKGEPTNFRDFILTVGAPRDLEYGGGTYGFGKTAAFRASQCGTIIVWTRIRGGEGFEERFIAISIIPNFSMGEKRYTGQQWWGRDQRLKDGMNVQPIEGDAAHGLGTKLFERGFGEQETGTSIMILDPAFDDGGQEGFVQETADAVARNLWPKMIPGQPVDKQMKISLIENGHPVDLAAGWDDRIRASRESCLTAIRKVQSGQKAEEAFIDVSEIRCGNPKQLLGHLAIAPCPFGSDDELVNSVTLMREPELVVCEKEYPDLQNGRDSWVAVFKPIRELDNAFAEAEPPTHDDWKPDSLERRKGTFVRVALRRIKEDLKDYLNPVDDDVQPGERVSAGRLAASLDVLAVGADGDLASGMPTGRRSRSRGSKRRASVEVLSQELLPMPDASDGRALTRLELRASAGANLMTVTPDLAVVVEGSGVIKDAEQVRVDSWTTAEGEVTAAERLQVHGGDVFYVDISYPENAAVNCTFRSEVTK